MSGKFFAIVRDYNSADEERGLISAIVDMTEVAAITSIVRCTVDDVPK